MQEGFTPAVAVHVAAALAAMALGAIVFFRRKGSFAHRMLGRAWVALMLLTAVSTCWIRMSGSFSWIHGLSVLTLLGLTSAVAYAIRGDIARHLASMIAVYVGALVVAGAFTLLPNRLLGQMLWSALGVL